MTLFDEVQRYSKLTESQISDRFFRVLYSQLEDISNDKVLDINTFVKTSIDVFSILYDFSGTDTLILTSSLYDLWILTIHNKQPLSYEIFINCLFSVSKCRNYPYTISNKKFIGTFPLSLGVFLDVFPNLVVEDKFPYQILKGEFKTISSNHTSFELLDSMADDDKTRVYGVTQNVMGDIAKHLVKQKKLTSEFFNDRLYDV
jgi:hypothetical protein